MRDDGTWSIWFEGPPDLSTSIEAYVALRMCGVDPGPQRARVHPARGRHPEEPPLHEVLPRAARPVAVAADGADPARARAAAAVGAVLDLQLRVLGAPDVRRARARAVAAAGAARSTSTCRRSARCRDGRVPPRRPNALRRRALRAAEQWIRDRQEADGSWGGIQPPWVWGIIALDRARPRLRRPDAAQGGRGLAGLHGRRRRPAPPRGVPVARVGHGPRRARAARVRRARRSSAAPRGGRVPARPGGDGQRRLGDPRARPRARRLGVRVRERPLPRHRRRRGHLARAAAARHRRRRGRGAASTGSSACSRAAAAGARSTSTTRRCGSTRSRSATSAR